MRRVIALSATVTATMFAGSAHADEAEACINASEKAQQYRDQQRLLDARTQLLSCAREVCPPPVKKDCAELLADVVRRTPSFVVRAKGLHGEDVVDASVSIDGKVATDRLTGAPISLDPGEHSLHVELMGGASRDQKVVAVQGEHERLITVDFSEGAPAQGRGQRIGGVVIGVSGLAAIAVGAAFGVVVINDANAQKADCLTSAQCPNPTGAAAAHSDALTASAVSTIAVIGGAALFLTGVFVYLTAPKNQTIRVGLSGLGVMLHGEF